MNNKAAAASMFANMHVYKAIIDQCCVYSLLHFSQVDKNKSILFHEILWWLNVATKQAPGQNSAAKKYKKLNNRISN